MNMPLAPTFRIRRRPVLFLACLLFVYSAAVTSPKRNDEAWGSIAGSRAGDAAFDPEIRLAALTCHLDPLLIKSVIAVESEFDFLSVSPKGARGLMQLHPRTAKLLHVQDVFVPQENILGGSRHLRYLLSVYHNNLPLALAAYNAGEVSVRRYGAVPPFGETQRYVKKVLDQYAAYKAGRA